MNLILFEKQNEIYKKPIILIDVSLFKLISTKYYKNLLNI